MKNKKINIIILIILLIVIIVILLIIKSLIEKKEEIELNEIEQNTHISSYYTNEDEKTNSISIVTDRNDFFTVTFCVNNYLNYLSQGNAEILYNLLDNTYKSSNNITEQNILDKLEGINTYREFSPIKIYYYNDSSSKMISYYVIGTIKNISLDSETEENTYYIIINMDKENGTYSVIPDKNMFPEEIKN